MEKLIISLTSNRAIQISIDTFRIIKNLEDVRRLSDDITEVIRKLNAINVTGIAVSASIQSGFLDEIAEEVLKNEK